MPDIGGLLIILGAIAGAIGLSGTTQPAAANPKPKPGPVPPSGGGGGGGTGGGGGGGGGTGPGGFNPATEWHPNLQRYVHEHGNTAVAFEVNPWNPPKIIGAPVQYDGRLIYTSDLPILIPDGAVIEFWDNAKGAPFLYTMTQGAPFAQDGSYSAVRELQPDELDGYYVVAVYKGGVIDYYPIGPFGEPITVPLTTYVTGIWHVSPGA